MAALLPELLRKIRMGLKERDVSALRKLSKVAIRESMLKGEERFFKVALLSRILSKLISKTHYWTKTEKRKFVLSTVQNIRKCEELLSKGEEEDYEDAIDDIFDSIRNIESLDKRYIHDLETGARLKLASDLYGMGFSLSRAAEFTGSHKQDLLRFVGRTLLADRTGKTKNIEERLRYVRALFR